MASVDRFYHSTKLLLKPFNTLLHENAKPFSCFIFIFSSCSQPKEITTKVEPGPSTSLMYQINYDLTNFNKDVVAFRKQRLKLKFLFMRYANDRSIASYADFKKFVLADAETKEHIKALRHHVKRINEAYPFIKTLSKSELRKIIIGSVSIFSQTASTPQCDDLIQDPVMWCDCERYVRLSNAYDIWSADLWGSDLLFEECVSTCTFVHMEDPFQIWWTCYVSCENAKYNRDNIINTGYSNRIASINNMGCNEF